MNPATHPRGIRRGVSLLPSLFTIANLFCGWSCVVYAMRGDLETAAPFVGLAMVLDMLDGRIARMTGTSSEFGVQLDSLADIISFGMAPAVLAYAWGLQPLGRLGWAAGFIYTTAAAMRLARFNIQTGASHLDKRYFLGLPSPAAAGLVAATVFVFPYPLSGLTQNIAAIAVVLVPAALMVSTMRFRSFKTIDFGHRRSYLPIIVAGVIFAAIAANPPIALVLIAYGYLLSAFIEWGITRLRPRAEPAPPAA